MPEQLHARVETCFRLAEAYFEKRFHRPRVSFQLRGQKAGVAHLDDNLLRFNPRLYQENRVDFLRQTVAHEVAHLIVHQRFGRNAQPHGREWQAVMNEVYRLPAERCHSYSVQRRPSTHYLYRCACPEQLFPLSARRHGMIARGRRYFCKVCKADLCFTGELARG